MPCRGVRRPGPGSGAERVRKFAGVVAVPWKVLLERLGLPSDWKGKLVLARPRDFAEVLRIASEFKRERAAAPESSTRMQGSPGKMR